MLTERIAASGDENGPRWEATIFVIYARKHHKIWCICSILVRSKFWDAFRVWYEAKTPFKIELSALRIVWNHCAGLTLIN